MAANTRSQISSAVRSDNSKKQEIMKELQQLKIREQNLEREKATQLYGRHGDINSEVAALQQLEQTMSTGRKSNAAKIRQQLNKAKDMVRKFRRELEHINPTPEFLEKLKVVMEEIESEISAIREQQKAEFDELSREERVLSQEVDALDHRFDAWLLPNALTGEAPKTHRTAAPGTTRDIIADLPPEVAAFELFVQQSGGHCGGWDDIEHATFMKFRNRFKGKVGFIRELASGPLPTRTEKEIRDHETWYQEYTQRNERKKEVIQKWREKKEIEREEMVAKATKSESAKAESDSDDEVKKQQTEREKREQRERLNKWKLEKELRKAEEEEKRLKEQLDIRKQQEQEKMRQMEISKKVKEYKKLKEREEEEQKQIELARLQAEVDEKQRQATELISRFRERDLEAVKEKRDRERREKERLEQEKQQRLDRLRSQVEVNVERDPQRLYRLTEGWRERQKDAGPSGSGPVLNIPHRAIPTWRQGLS